MAVDEGSYRWRFLGAKTGIGLHETAHTISRSVPRLEIPRIIAPRVGAILRPVGDGESMGLRDHVDRHAGRMLPTLLCQASLALRHGGKCNHFHSDSLCRLPGSKANALGIDLREVACEHNGQAIRSSQIASRFCPLAAIQAERSGWQPKTSFLD
jgi:hypothetical protein